MVMQKMEWKHQHSRHYHLKLLHTAVTMNHRNHHVAKYHLNKFRNISLQSAFYTVFHDFDQNLEFHSLK